MRTRLQNGPLGCAKVVLSVALVLRFAMSAASAAPPPNTRVGGPMGELVEADWLQRDGGRSLAQTREIIRRGQKLAERLQTQAEARKLRPLKERLGKLDARLAKVESAGTLAEADQRELWLEAHHLVREIALCNPRLREIDKLLFITRHDAGGVFHMVDQFYGFNARPGGWLLVLVDPLSNEPKLVDVLAGGQLVFNVALGRGLREVAKELPREERTESVQYDLPEVVEPGESGYFVGHCPVLRGCVAQGRTREEAQANLKKAIASYLGVLQEMAEEEAARRGDRAVAART